MRRAFPPDNFLASNDVSTVLIFSWLRGFSFLRLTDAEQPEEIVRRDKKKKARKKFRAFVISVDGGLNSPCRPCHRQAKVLLLREFPFR